MKEARSSLAAAFLTLSVCISMASGGAPMGPPIATLSEGQWSLGGEFALERLDLEAFGTSTETYEGGSTVTAQCLKIEDLEATMLFGTFAYGLCDNWNVFVRVGAADAQDDVILHTETNASADRFGFDGDMGFAWGVGTRATFCRSGPWTFGGLVQVTWFNPGDSDFQYGDPADAVEGAVAGDASIDYWQTQVALTVACQIDTWTLWAGPFLQYVEGDLDLDGQIVLDEEIVGRFDCATDIEESSQFGGQFGANWGFADHWNLWVEGQVTGDSWLVGIGTAFIPEALGL
jgi:hypothetical protein